MRNVASRNQMWTSLCSLMTSCELIETCRAPKHAELVVLAERYRCRREKGGHREDHASRSVIQPAIQPKPKVKIVLLRLWESEGLRLKGANVSCSSSCLGCFPRKKGHCQWRLVNQLSNCTKGSAGTVSAALILWCPQSGLITNDFPFNMMQG